MIERKGHAEILMSFNFLELQDPNKTLVVLYHKKNTECVIGPPGRNTLGSYKKQKDATNLVARNWNLIKLGQKCLIPA